MIFLDASKIIGYKLYTTIVNYTKIKETEEVMIHYIGWQHMNVQCVQVFVSFKILVDQQ